MPDTAARSQILNTPTMQVTYFNPYKAGSGGGGGVAGSFEGSYFNDSPLAVVTYSNAPLGTPSTDRIIAVPIIYRRNQAIISVSINGVSASQAVYQQAIDSRFNVAIWFAVVPTGSTGDIVVTFDNNPEWADLAVYSIRGASGLDTTADANNGTYLTSTLTASSGAFLVAAATQNTPSLSIWDTPMVEDYDRATSPGGNDDGATTASQSNSGGGSQDVSVTLTGSSSSFTALAVASFS
jgi:hypothetical protein